MTRIAVLFLIVLFLAPNGRSGREGNRAFEAGDYAAAEAEFRRGLDRAGENPDMRARLLNNLGAALYRQGRFEEAAEAFNEAVDTARKRREMTRAAHNAGNAAYRLDDLQRAQSYFRQALLADPQNEAARFNYEFVTRRLDDHAQGQDEQPGGPPIQPSEYARNLKARADQLVARRQYVEALTLMREGRQVDRTVDAYRQYINRLADIVEIEGR